MYGLLGFPENLNFQNCVNSIGSCVHQMYGLSRFVENLNSMDMLNVQNCVNLTRNWVHQMYRLFEFAKKFEYQKLRTFNEKLCTLDVQIV